MARRERDAPESEDLRSITGVRSIWMALEMRTKGFWRSAVPPACAGVLLGRNVQHSSRASADQESDASAMRDLLLSWLKEANN